MQRVFIAALLSVAISSPAHAEAGGDPERGEKLYRQCSSCHAIGEGASNRTGPHLNNIFDRSPGQVEGFRYSPALLTAAEEGLAWDMGTLDAFLTNPREFVRGTRMSYRGMRDAQDRADVLSYIRLFSSDPESVPKAPSAASASDQTVDPAVLAIVGDPAYGEYLSGECTSCHQSDGGASGIPNITKWPEETFVIAMHAYKSGQREHSVMQMMAGRLSNEEIAALAAYFATIE